MASRVSAVRDVLGLPAEDSLLLAKHDEEFFEEAEVAESSSSISDDDIISDRSASGASDDPDDSEQEENLDSVDLADRSTRSLADPGCTAQAIASWCADCSVDVLSCSVSESRYFGTAYAHLLVPKSQESVVIDEEFWPSKVTARLWRFKADAQQEATEKSNSPCFDSMTNSTSS